LIRSPEAIGAVLDFLPCRTPAGWVTAAIADIDTLLRDHAGLELKAAQQAQKLMWTYGFESGPGVVGGADRYVLLNRLSRLAREELRHFEQVLCRLDERRVDFAPVSASRYATGLHKLVAQTEPARLVDLLIVGAVIEARSCERFHRLVPALESADPALAKFYGSLLRSEARHFGDYLELADRFCPQGLRYRVERVLDEDERLVLSDDSSFRFHSGNPDESVVRHRA
jgi:tRNA-(ms[2]io[6]A)-hydroxylase